MTEASGHGDAHQARSPAGSQVPTLAPLDHLLDRYCDGDLDGVMALCAGVLAHAVGRDPIEHRDALAVACGWAAEALLLRGDYCRGWAAWERWWHFRVVASPTSRMPPRWAGDHLSDGLVLLIGDAGVGDVILFSRYIPWARARCADVGILADERLRPFLTPLLSHPSMFFALGEPTAMPFFDAHCALSELPRLADTRVDTIPPPVPLQLEPGMVARWRERIAASVPSGMRRVGIVWSSHLAIPRRSMTLADLGPIADLDAIALVSLQTGEAADQARSYAGKAPLIDFRLHDLGDIAAVAENVDLIIAVDCSIAHIAAALGRRTWVMLPYAPDWRWLLYRDDSPWFPTARLFRQGADRQWEPVITRVAAELTCAGRTRLI